MTVKIQIYRFIIFILLFRDFNDQLCYMTFF